jgi:hypothetical protein
MARAKIIVTNFHAFLRREKVKAGKLTKQILARGDAGESAFTESEGEMARRVCRGLGNKRQIRTDKEGKLTVEIRGLDVYDPTTGEIRSSSTDDIACWFIDTNYNGESFFVRHAYFTGGDEPYDKLKRALRAEIDEAAWRQLYATTSRPFDPPETGKIAVKVINHCGDEVLKVYDVSRTGGPGQRQAGEGE